MRARSLVLAALVASSTLVHGQITDPARRDLRRYRYGLPAARIVAMGFDRFDVYYRARTPEADQGAMRGVSYGAFVDAKRELNAARRVKRPPAEQKRLIALDRQIRFLGVLAARNAWLFNGGNAVDPEADTEPMADAETELLSGTRVRSGPDALHTIAAYEARLAVRAKREGYFGAVDDGPAQTRANVAKMRTAARTALGLTRNARERGVVARFLASELSES